MNTMANLPRDDYYIDPATVEALSNIMRNNVNYANMKLNLMRDRLPTHPNLTSKLSLSSLMTDLGDHTYDKKQLKGTPVLPQELTLQKTFSFPFSNQKPSMTSKKGIWVYDIFTWNANYNIEVPLQGFFQCVLCQLNNDYSSLHIYMTKDSSHFIDLKCIAPAGQSFSNYNAINMWVYRTNEEDLSEVYASPFWVYAAMLNHDYNSVEYFRLKIKPEWFSDTSSTSRAYWTQPIQMESVSDIFASTSTSANPYIYIPSITESVTIVRFKNRSNTLATVDIGNPWTYVDTAYDGYNAYVALSTQYPEQLQIIKMYPTNRANVLTLDLANFSSPSSVLVGGATMKLLVICGIPILINRGGTEIVRLCFDDTDTTSPENYYVTLTSAFSLDPSDSIYDAIDYNDRLLIHAYSGLYLYDFELDQVSILPDTDHVLGNGLAPTERVAAYPSAIAITSSDDILLTSKTSVFTSDGEFGFYTMEMPFSVLPTKRTLISNSTKTIMDTGLVERGSILDIDTRSWFMYKPDFGDKIVSVCYYSKGDGYFVCNTSDNKLINLRFKSTGIEIEYYTEDTAVNKSNSQLYMYSSNMYFFDGTNAYRIDPVNLVYTKSTDTSAIPSSAARTYFNTAKDTKRIYRRSGQNDSSCVFIQRNKTTNVCNIYRFTGNSPSALTLTSNTQISGIRDLDCRLTAMGDFVVTATVNGKRECRRNALASNATYANWQAFANTCTAETNSETAVLIAKGETPRFPVSTSEGSSLFGDMGYYSNAKDLSSHLYNNQIYDPVEITSGIGRTALVLFNYTTNTICYAYERYNFNIKMFRGTTHVNLKAIAAQPPIHVAVDKSKYKILSGFFISRGADLTQIRISTLSADEGQFYPLIFKSIHNGISVDSMIFTTLSDGTTTMLTSDIEANASSDSDMYTFNLNIKDAIPTGFAEIDQLFDYVIIATEL